MSQPEALRLADAISNPEGEPNWQTCLRAAAELRRLHFELDEASQLAAHQSQRAMDYAGAFMREREANAELVKALQTILNVALMDGGHWAKTIEAEARAAITKATEGHDGAMP